METVTGPASGRCPVPIPDNPLRYVLSYLIEHDAGVLLVDPGWNPRTAGGADRRARPRARSRCRAVTAVLVTHVHPDHHGQSGAVREASGAWVGMHEREDAFLELRGDRGMMRDGMQMYLRWCGAPDSHLERADRRAGAPSGPARRRWSGPTG